MSAWKTDELESISGVDEVQVASRRTDGSLRPFVTIWAVRHGDDVYVRSAHGPKNGWFVRAVASGEGRLHAGRVERDITFERPDPSVDAGVDGAYHAKYDRYGPSTVGTVVGPEAAQTTLRLVPGQERERQPIERITTSPGPWRSSSRSICESPG